jgi:hypothetical protein
MNDFPTSPGHDRDDERIRRLLDEAVSDVEPRDSLASIHARTKVSPMRSKRSWILGGAVVATAATVAAVAVLSNGTPEQRNDVGPAATASPSPTEEATPSPTEEPTQEPTATDSPEPTMAAVPVYYVGDTSRGVRLYREFHRVDTGGDAVSAAVNEAVSTSPTDPDYRTDWPQGTSAAQVDAPPSDVITIDVRGAGSLRSRSGLNEERAQMAIEQLVYTAQAADQSRSPVQLLLNGGRTDTLLGVPVSEPLAQGDAMDVLAQVWIIEPGEGAEVNTPFKVSGLAAAFEATVLWELRQGGTVVKEGFTTAEECCRMAPYSFTVKGVPAGEYTLVVTDNDPSGGEGFGVWEDTKQITVLP